MRELFHKTMEFASLRCGSVFFFLMLWIEILIGVFGWTLFLYVKTHAFLNT